MVNIKLIKKTHLIKIYTFRQKKIMKMFQAIMNIKLLFKIKNKAYILKLYLFSKYFRYLLF